jgi:hypothetical protein
MFRTGNATCQQFAGGARSSRPDGPHRHWGSLVNYLDAALNWDPKVIRLRDHPLLAEGGIAVLAAPATASVPERHRRGEGHCGKRVGVVSTRSASLREAVEGFGQDLFKMTDRLEVDHRARD